LIVADSLSVGGTERQVLELIKGLRQSGRFRVVLAVLDPGGGFESEAIALCEAVLPVRRRSLYGLTPVLSLLRHAYTSQVQLIHAFGRRSAFAGLVAARVCHIPIVDGSVRDTPLALSRRVRASRWSAVHSDASVANSHAGLDAYGLSGHAQAHVIANGVDLRRFEGVVPEVAATPTVCMVANFSRYKDHASAVRALPAIRRAIPQSRLMLVGQNVGRLSQAKQLIAELGLLDVVQFAPRTIQPQSIIAGSHVCLLTSMRGESCSNAILEYMALGKPVVATACAGNAELIEDGTTGFLVPPDSPEAVADRVIYLLRHPERALAMGAAGRRRIHEHYSLPRMVAQYESLYDQLLDTSRIAKPAPTRTSRRST
jgi:glycosyltransferase involved in cell wall biosynthesis